MGRSSRAFLLIAGALAGCAETYETFGNDRNLEFPEDFEIRARRFRSGEEPWHGDPKRVADFAIRTFLDVPWKADPYLARDYELLNKPEWGDYVIRGYVYPSGHEMRYRVKVRRHQDIWYPVQVSYYKVHGLPDDRDSGRSP